MGYGGPEVLQVKELTKPKPKDDEILVRIRAAEATSGDARIRGSDFPPLFWLPARLIFGPFKPRKPVLGYGLGGVIEEVGKGVTHYKEGDEIFGASGWGFGAYAEYITLKEDGILSVKPASMTFDEASTVAFGGLTALHFLRKGDIQKGQKVLIYGASGAVGTYSVQLARYFGAEVTGVCSSANLELVRSLGAHKVIDYTKEDFTKKGERYDLIFDTVGKSPFTPSLRSLKKGGAYLLAVHMELLNILKGLLVTIIGDKRVVGGATEERSEDLEILKELIEAGDLRPHIDRTYPLDQISEAHGYVDGGHKRGSVVLTIPQ